ncbi:hypothetical protein BJ508DRAFT_82267 [Ascobolus immersus RN42]|uniref:Uncharacterized protein n=1 Tax=Ascobolus immersus RN42 TaxID=1160509 RepID=A0A3N4HFR2_ASCIM|nr:hypothetical protein BJ508DRAFT_82267 [Ascobolus immersus RN42]
MGRYKGSGYPRYVKWRCSCKFVWYRSSLCSPVRFRLILFLAWRSGVQYVFYIVLLVWRVPSSQERDSLIDL